MLVKLISTVFLHNRTKKKDKKLIDNFQKTTKTEHVQHGRGSSQVDQPEDGDCHR